MARQYVDVDPRTLLLPSSRIAGANPVKLQRQIALYGTSDQGMPPIEVYRTRDGRLMIMSGVTRATRIAKLCPGRLVRVEITGDWKGKTSHLPTVGDTLP